MALPQYGCEGGKSGGVGIRGRMEVRQSDCINAEGEPRPEPRRALPQRSRFWLTVVKKPLLRAFFLEQELQHKLNQPWINRAHRNLAKASAVNILRRERRVVYRVKRKLWMVEGVEELAPELERLTLPNLDVLADGHIPVVLPW